MSSCNLCLKPSALRSAMDMNSQVPYTHMSMSANASEPSRVYTYGSQRIFRLSIFPSPTAQLPVDEQTNTPFLAFLDENDIVQADISMESSSQDVSRPCSWKSMSHYGDESQEQSTYPRMHSVLRVPTPLFLGAS